MLRRDGRLDEMQRARALDSNKSDAAESLGLRIELFECIEPSVRAPEVNDAFDDEGRRKNRADRKLPVGRDEWSLPPDRVVKQRFVKAAVLRQDPTFVLL